jgi:hypothetical protein
MQLAAETTMTKKFLRESMTMAQYQVAWQHYHAVLTQRMEAEVSDDPAAGDGGSPGASEDFVGPAEAGQLTDASEEKGRHAGSPTRLSRYPVSIGE